jgi:hypothetical protein
MDKKRIISILIAFSIAVSPIALQSEARANFYTAEKYSVKCFPRSGTTARSLSNIEIKKMQRELNLFQAKLAYAAPPISVNGIWGRKTFQRVTQYERYIHFEKLSTYWSLTHETLRSLGITC